MLEVSEIFGPTVQGEGKRVGHPSIFIRLTRCNLSCAGFKVEYQNLAGEKKYGCDTYYSVDPCFKGQWQKLSGKEIANQVADLSAGLPCDVVITGGEPLLFWKRTEFQWLLEQLITKGHLLTIETNASIDITFIADYQRKILFSMSVKLANSGEVYNKRINIAALQNILNSAENAYLKFVIDKHSTESSIQEIKQLTGQLPQVNVYLMPMGATLSELSENDQAVIACCVEHGYIYSDRAHIRVWDDERGV
jgi:organic radical activating enzyme